LTDDEDEDDGGRLASFSSRLTKFKKSSSKSCTGRSSYSHWNSYWHFSARKSQASDDDDFLVPSDSSIPISHLRSSSASSASSRRSSTAADSDEDSFIVPDSGTEIEDAQPKKSKSKTSKSTRPSLKKGDTETSSGGGSGFAFLTAAEQRAQGKKQEKKSTEDPYSFLLDVRDVRRLLFLFTTLLDLLRLSFGIL
jgi:DNA mismatch repair protein MSH6